MIIELRKKCNECEYDKSMTWSIDEPASDSDIKKTINHNKSQFSSHSHDVTFTDKVTSENEIDDKQLKEIIWQH